MSKSKRKSRKRIKPAAATSGSRKKLSVIALIVALSLATLIAVGWPMLGSGTNSGVNPASPQSQPTLSKEYIYAGGRLLATEEPPGGGPGCTFTINPTSQNFPAAGGSSNVGVSTQSGCAWTATSNALWISITSGASGSGSGSVNYSVASNPNPSPRTGTMTVAGQTFTVTQDPASGGCSFTINPSSQNFSATGGTGSVSVGTQSGCNWT
ncbi:MAG: BACON domain-containing protein, partial [Blastocatellia bacterium]|nr:BACON domain-containing protein [Blastocatellia bacterium]